jgi:hypothetical protein
MGTLSSDSALLRGLVVAVSVAILTAGCSSSSGTPKVSASPVQDAIDATTAAGSASFTGTSVDSAHNKNNLSGSWSGSLTASNGANAAGDMVTKLSIGGAPPAPVELRWTGGRAYLQRVAAPSATAASAGPVVIFTRGAAERPWVSFDVGTTAGALLLRPFNPAALLDQMSRTGAKVVGTSTVSGHQVTDIRTTQPLPVMGWWSSVTPDVFVDSHHRVVRVRLTSPIGGVQYDVKYAKQAKIQPPPSDQIVVPNAAVQPVDLAEPYTVATSGTTDGIAWKLERAKGKNGTVCWHWNAKPPLTQVLSNRPDGARCIPPPAAGDPPESMVQFAVDGNGSGPYDALAVSLPVGVKALTLGFVGGKTQAETPMNLFVWVGPASPAPAYLGVTLANGTKIDCGAGSVSTAADLTDSSLTDHAAGSPWGCLPAT